MAVKSSRVDAQPVKVVFRQFAQSARGVLVLAAGLAASGDDNKLVAAREVLSDGGREVFKVLDINFIWNNNRTAKGHYGVRGRWHARILACNPHGLW